LTLTERESSAKLARRAMEDSGESCERPDSRGLRVMTSIIRVDEKEKKKGRGKEQGPKTKKREQAPVSRARRRTYV